MTARGVYAELFTLQAAAYTDRPSANGNRRTTDQPPVAQLQQDTAR
jgi:hypothetical protein